MSSTHNSDPRIRSLMGLIREMVRDAAGQDTSRVFWLAEAMQALMRAEQDVPHPALTRSER